MSAYDSDIYAEGKETAVNSAKCPNCGGNLVFNPEKGAMFCEHCDTVIGLKNNQAMEQDFNKLFSTAPSWGNEARVFQCKNCGAKEVIGKKDIAKMCSFCGTPAVIETSEIAGLKPNAVVPFAINKQTAVERVIQWAKRKFFAPRSFKKDVNPENIHGLYNPAFTFDSQTFTYYTGRLAKTEHYTVRVNGRTQTRTRTVYFNIRGTYSKAFDDVLIQAATTISQKDINKLQPFATNQSKDYTDEYLQGFTASQYSKDGRVCWDEARTVMGKQIQKEILSGYQYSSVVSFNANTAYNRTTYKYLLLPIYVGHTTFKRKLFNFFVNGLNGKVTGKVPTSALKVTLVSLIGAAVLAGVAIAVVLLL